MIRFLSKYSHWILLVLVAGGLTVSFFNGTYDGASLIFGVIGVLGVGYLVYRIEADRKRKKIKN
ncbi:MAG TPA: hypothetical protein VK945_07930 [Planococcus sp. (in: firmicutes)]|nr:hypothetical protein [Planococcus sp. (in: firmicutes)]